jgi:biotin transporter BioY
MPGARVLAVAAGAASGSLLILVMGTLYLSLITGLSFAATIPLAFAPFIAGDVVKTAAAVIIAGKGR